MNLKAIFKKTTTCLLAALMIAGSVTLVPHTVTAGAAEKETVIARDDIKKNDLVTIKMGARDYYGNEINSMYLYLVYTVQDIIGNKATIVSDYYVSSVSYAAKLEMNINDLDIKTYSDTVNTDSDIQYVIGKGSDVYVKPGAIDETDGKEVNVFWRPFVFTVDDIEDDVASLHVRLTPEYLARLGISKEAIANVFNIDKDNQWLENLYNVITSIGYTHYLKVKLDSLELYANGVPNKAEIGKYRTNVRLMVEATTFRYTSGLQTETITVPVGTTIIVADYSNGYATVYLKLNGKYYATTKISLTDCEFVESGRELFSSNGLDEGSYVKVTDLYGTDTDSFIAYEESWFKKVEGKEDYPLVYDLLYKIQYAYGDAAFIAPVDNIVVNGESLNEMYSFVIPVDYLKTVAGTYRTKEAVNVQKQEFDSAAGVYKYTTLGTFGSNTVFYSDGQVLDGKLFVRYQNMFGCIEATKVEYVSENVINYTNYRVGDTVYIKKGTEKDYDGKLIFEDRPEKNYFGADYATEIFAVPFRVKFVANDWLELEETDESIAANNRDTDTYKFVVVLGTDRVSKSQSIDVDSLGDVDLNGSVDMNDIVSLQRHIAQLTILTSDGIINADVNGDGSVNMEDITTIQKYIAKIITRFPADK